MKSSLSRLHLELRGTHRARTAFVILLAMEAAPFSLPPDFAPRIGVILGSGLGVFSTELSNSITIPYASIPGIPASTAVGHTGQLVVGYLESYLNTLPVAILAGRAHLYEGYSAREVTQGVRLLHHLGVRSLIVTNAAGGIADSMQPGDLALISDHINLQGSNPLVGPAPAFPDMTEAYSVRFREIAREQASALDIELREGVYAALLGPSYETPAEIRYLARIGADLVGMSTVPEVIVANALGMRVLGISCVTNKAAGLGGKLYHEEVLAVGRRSRDRFIALLKAVIPHLTDAHV